MLFQSADLYNNCS